MAPLARGCFCQSALPPHHPLQRPARCARVWFSQSRGPPTIAAVCAESASRSERAAPPQPLRLHSLLSLARSLSKNDMLDSAAPWGLSPDLLAELEWVGGPLPVTLTQATSPPPSAPEKRPRPALEEAGTGTPGPGKDDEDGDPNKKSKDYYANVGDAIRTLRLDIPCIFWKPFDYSIYRSDVVFRDPNISFHGLTNYKLVIWSVTTFGKLAYSRKEVSVVNIWQPEEGVIKMRWQVQARPRLWWLAEGVFDGISEYRLDHSGRIYEHLVTNVQLRDPPLTNPLLYGLNLLMSPRLGPQPTRVPCPGSWSVGMPEDRDMPTIFGSFDG